MQSKTFDRYLVEYTVTAWRDGESRTFDRSLSVAAVSPGAARTVVGSAYPSNYDVEFHHVTKRNE